MLFKNDYGDIYYEVYGPEGAPAIVFTHGVTLDHKSFYSQVSQFSDRYKVVVWDLPGHGKSFPASQEFSFELASECLIGLLDEIKIDSVILVGVSLGGLVNQYIAYHFPDRVLGLAEMGSIPLDQKFSSLTKSLMALYIRSVWLIPEKVIIKMFSKYYAKQPDTQRYLKEMASSAGKEHILNLSMAMLKSVFVGIEGPVTKPLLIINGETEFGPVKRIARKWHKKRPNSQHETIPNAGHVCNQDNPNQVNEVLELFFKRIKEQCML